jgi:nicotinamide-nucleotide amidase
VGQIESGGRPPHSKVKWTVSPDTSGVSAADLDRAAERLAGRLVAGHHKLVLAESCTAGLVAHTLSRIPGASNWLCGSAVVYRDGTKAAWLDVSAESRADPAIGAVSEQTALAMCRGAIAHTPEATLAASITGHIGPNAPEGLDGVVYIAAGTTKETVARRVRLTSELPASSDCPTLRVYRQCVAALVLLELLDEFVARV